jgi:hypothetical protein
MKHNISQLKINWLVLFKEIIAAILIIVKKE